jgi:hypothetical protein
VGVGGRTGEEVVANTVAQIRADILDVLNTVDAAGNIGVIHDYERWALHWENVLTILRDPTDGVVRSWMIAYRGHVPEPMGSFYSTVPDQDRSLTVRAHRWLIRGVLAVDDGAESEKTFATNTETVANALDADPDLHNQTKYWGDPPSDPVSLDAFEIRVFAGVLCHVAEISMVVRSLHVGGALS